MGRAARDKETGMTDKEEVFCQYVVNHPECNDSDAYKAAYNCARMKPDTINRNAYALKNSSHIVARINLLRSERSERTKIDSDYVLTRLADMDQLDVLDILTDEGNLKPVREWPKVWRISISSIDIQTTKIGEGDIESIVSKIKFPDKVKNLELIGKHVEVQAWNEKKTIEVGKSLQDLLKAAAED